MTMRIQRCEACGTFNYPSRSLCRTCLADALVEREDSGSGVLLAVTTLRRSFEPAFGAVLPLRIGTVRLDCGPHIVSVLADDVLAGDRIRIAPAGNPLGEAVWKAEPA